MNDTIEIDSSARDLVSSRELTKDFEGRVVRSITITDRLVNEYEFSGMMVIHFDDGSMLALSEADQAGYIEYSIFPPDPDVRF